MQVQDLHASKGKCLALVEDNGTEDLFGSDKEDTHTPVWHPSRRIKNDRWCLEFTVSRPHDSSDDRIFIDSSDRDAMLKRCWTSTFQLFAAGRNHHPVMDADAADIWGR
jgi:hypothetical protein